MVYQARSQEDALSATFAALADPTRRAILARLRHGEVPVTELAEPFDMSLPAISKHLRVLENAGLISRTRDAQRRPCRIEPVRLEEATAFLESYRELWEGRFDRLGAFVELLKERERAGAEPAGPAPKTQKKTQQRDTKDNKEQDRHGRNR